MVCVNKAVEVQEAAAGEFPVLNGGDPTNDTTTILGKAKTQGEAEKILKENGHDVSARRETMDIEDCVTNDVHTIDVWVPDL